MDHLPVNDILQWSAVIAIVLIAAIRLIRKLLRFRRTLKNGVNPECGCGCSDCNADCAMRDTIANQNHKQHNSKN